MIPKNPKLKKLISLQKKIVPESHFHSKKPQYTQINISFQLHVTKKKMEKKRKEEKEKEKEKMLSEETREQ